MYEKEFRSDKVEIRNPVKVIRKGKFTENETIEPKKIHEVKNP